MGFLSGLFKSRDAPTNRTSGSAFGFFMGNSSSGKSVNERSAMQMTAVYACVRVLSESLASLPLHFYKHIGSSGKEKAVDHPLYFLLHGEPNPEMSSFVFRETLMVHLLLWGNAYAQIIRNGKGEVLALYPLMPDRMTVERDSNAHVAQDQKDYQRRYDELVSRYEGTKERLEHVQNTIADRLARRSAIGQFIETLQRQDGIITEFDEALWGSLVDHIIIFDREKVRFFLKSGAEA